MKKLDYIRYVKVGDIYCDFAVKMRSEDMSTMTGTFWDRDEGIEGGFTIKVISDVSYEIINFYLNGEQLLNEHVYTITGDDIYVPVNEKIVLSIKEYYSTIESIIITLTLNPINEKFRLIVQSSNNEMSELDCTIFTDECATFLDDKMELRYYYKRNKFLLLRAGHTSDVICVYNDNIKKYLFDDPTLDKGYTLIEDGSIKLELVNNNL